MAEVRSTKGEDFFEEAPVVKENNEALDKVAVAPASEPVIVRKTNKSPVILGVIILSVVLAVIIALVCIGFATKNQGEMELLYEEVQGGIAITGVKNCGAEVVIPSEINGKPVVKIGERAFFECTSLTSVVIPNSVTSIGYFAFEGCNSLEEITVPFVGDGRYETHFGYIFGAPNCRDNSYCVPASLKKVTILGGKIGDNAFQYCSGLTSVTLPNSVTAIGENAFAGCTSLTSVTLPNSVTTIGEFAFVGCEGITSIVIPDSVKSIGWCAFHHCNSLEEITVPFVGDGSDNTHFGYIFGASNYALNYDCIQTSLKKVTILGGKIEKNAFDGCGSLTSVTIGDRVTTIGEYAFTNCKSLINVIIGNGATSTGNSITTIGKYAFEGCESLTNVTLGDSVTTIGASAFRNCIGLTSITIPNSVTTIGVYAFKGCYSLTRVTIPISVTLVGNLAFDGCTNLTIYCEATSEPSNWDYYWNNSNCPVVWGYKES